MLNVPKKSLFSFSFADKLFNIIHIIYINHNR